ncbi:sestrin-3 [Scleropages formosus]|uniref:Sestrin 4 n=1 Tax=Scleropages formosus TaxID=113540 RepID=A0A8C9SV21_SCLFO|nr:sestrin-3-like [Scleropages formosus]
MIICTSKMEYPLGSQCPRQCQVDKERASLLCVKALASRGRLDTVTQHMAFHPQYLESFLRSQHYILHMDGPLPLPYRHYIAIMAAARHHCSYLVSLHSAQFLRVGGDPLWLQGLEAAPARLQHLDHINKVLAHRPWLSGRAHIQALLSPGEQCWSLAELVQAVVLLAHCHALCSFVFGLGTDPESQLAPRVRLGTPPGYCPCDAANGNASEPERRPRRWSLDSSCEVACLRERIPRAQGDGDKTEEQLGLHTLGHADTDEEEEVPYAVDPSCFITDPDFGYQEFARREEDHFQVFRVQDYSWEDHGFSLANRLYSDIGHLLDERFRCVAALPSPRGPDLRRAIWNYIHCMLGIRYDDYDYGEVNQLLEHELKFYIKAVACFPDATRSALGPLPCTLLMSSDKIHVNLLIMEARLQAELLYALRAITQHMIG